MELSDVIGEYSDEELDSWALSQQKDRAGFYDSTLARDLGTPAEWGLMDDEKHPVHGMWEDHKFLNWDWRHPGSLLCGPNGSDWELIGMSPHSIGTDETQIIDRKTCPTLKHSNSGWESTLRDLSRVGRPDGTKGEFMRPEGKWILDLVKSENGDDLLEAAHVLTHSFGRSLLVNVARLHVCLKFGIPLFVDGKQALDVLGIEVIASADIRKPTGFVPVMDFGMPTELVVFAGVYTEPHPKSYDKSDGWLEVNRWSCEPSMSCLAGFEYPNFICKSPIVGRFPGSKRNPLYMVPVPCMMPMSDFGKALSIRVRDVFRSGGWKSEESVEEWIGTETFRRLLGSTPPLPCKDCLRLNTQAEGHPLRPKSQKPDDMKTAPVDVRKEWEEYEEKMDKIFEIVDKASCYHDGRKIGHSEAKRERRRRRTAYNKKKNLEDRITSLSRRAKSFYKKGNLDKTIELRSKEKELVKKLEELNGLH